MRLPETTSRKHTRRPGSLVEHWAQALGVPQDRLTAIVKEVVEERLALRTATEPHRQRRLVAQPVE